MTLALPSILTPTPLEKCQHLNRVLGPGAFRDGLGRREGSAIPTAQHSPSLTPEKAVPETSLGEIMRKDHSKLDGPRAI